MIKARMSVLSEQHKVVESERYKFSLFKVPNVADQVQLTIQRKAAEDSVKISDVDELYIFFQDIGKYEILFWGLKNLFNDLGLSGG